MNAEHPMTQKEMMFLRIQHFFKKFEGLQMCVRMYAIIIFGDFILSFV
jgi:hypothetical protein